MHEGKLLVSVHIPKTGGTSLVSEIRSGGLGRYLLDYDDRVGRTDVAQRLKRTAARIKTRLHGQQLLHDYDVIHGHFLARKYAFMGPQARFISFVRDPVQRLLSGFFYMKYVHAKNPASAANPFVRMIVDGRISIVDYARLPHQVGLYEKFLSGVGLEDYLLIGITERFNESIQMLNGLLGTAVQSRHERSNDFSRYADEYQRWMPDLEQANRENARIYAEALRIFERRLSAL